MQNEGGQIVALFRLSNRCRNTHDESDGKNRTRDQHARGELRFHHGKCKHSRHHEQHEDHDVPHATLLFRTPVHRARAFSLQRHPCSTRRHAHRKSQRANDERKRRKQAKQRHARIVAVRRKRHAGNHVAERHA